MKNIECLVGYLKHHDMWFCEYTDYYGYLVWITPIGIVSKRAIQDSSSVINFGWKSKREMMAYIHKKYKVYKKGPSIKIDEGNFIVQNYRIKRK